MNQPSNNSFKNPYQPMTAESTTTSDAKVRSVSLWCIVGMVAFASVPAIIGTNGLIHEHAYAASLPPGTARCGNGMLAVLMILVVGVPLFAFAGAITGWLAAKLWPS